MPQAYGIQHAALLRSQGRFMCRCRVFQSQARRTLAQRVAKMPNLVMISENYNVTDETPFCLVVTTSKS